MPIYRVCNPSKSFLTRWLVLSAVVLAIYLPSLNAQDTATMPASTDVERVIANIEDEQKRAELLAQLRLLNTASQAADTPQIGSSGADILLELSQWVHGASAELVRSLSTLTTLPTEFSELGSRLVASGNTTNYMTVVAKIAAALLCAWLTQAVVKRLLARQRIALEGSTPRTLFSKTAIQFGRATIELLEIGAFTICAYLVMSVLRLGENPQLLMLAIINVILITRAVMVFARLLFSPDFGDLRLIPASDESAHYWFLWIRRLSAVGVYGYLSVETALLLGLPPTIHKVSLDLLGLIVLSMLIVVVQQNRQEVAAKIAGSQSTTVLIAVLRRQFAAFWNVFAVIYLIFVYAVWVAALPGGFSFIWVDSALSMLVVVLAMGIGFGLHSAIDRGFRLTEDLRARIPSLEQRMNRYLPQLKATASVMVCVLAIIAILNVWDVQALRWIENNTVGEIGSRLANIILILLVAYLVWEALSIAIEHGLARAKEASGDHARLETILPLASKTALVIICTMVSMIVLSELGINIGPLLAAAGVMGLAVGFGAQTLVKDIITGVFILIENSISVGDYVEVGGHEGEVENVSIRTIQLRDIEGSVHTVPFSAVSTVLNYTRDFSISKLDISVAYREDVDRVIDVLHQIGEGMLADPELAKDILEPLVVQGVQSLGDSSVNIRARIKTTAGKQWAMRRMFYGRMKKRFDELGIEIPFPHRTVYFGIDQQGQAPAAQVQIKPLNVDK